MASSGLCEVLGGDLPPGILALPESVQDDLAALVRAAGDAQARDLDVAFEGVLRGVPFPVRPLARKILRG